MRTVKVKLHAADLSREMAVLREWLDRMAMSPENSTGIRTEIPSSYPLSSWLMRPPRHFARRFDGESDPPLSVPGQLALCVE